jgi:hypothetical protein
MKQKTLIGLFIVTSLLLTSCATGPKFTSAPPPPSGKALIYVYRKGSIVGAAGYSRIYVNGELQGSLSNGGYETCNVPEGTVSFSTLCRAIWALPGIAALTRLQQEQNERLRFQAEAGKTYYIKWSIGDKMKLVDTETGSKDIEGLHLVTPEKD